MACDADAWTALCARCTLANGRLASPSVCSSRASARLVASEARAKVAREGRAEVTEADMMAALQTLGFPGLDSAQEALFVQLPAAA